MSQNVVFGAAQAVLDVDNGFEHMAKNATKPQYVCSVSQLTSSPPPVLVRHTLFLLPLLVVLSSFILLASYLVPKLYRCIVARSRQPIFLDDDETVVQVVPEPYMPSQGLWSDFTAHIRRLRTNGTTIVVLDVLRLLCIAALLGLSIYATVLAEELNDGKGKKKRSMWDTLKKKKKKKNKSVLDQYSTLEWGEFGACIFYVRIVPPR